MKNEELKNELNELDVKVIVSKVYSEKKGNWFYTLNVLGKLVYITELEYVGFLSKCKGQ